MTVGYDIIKMQKRHQIYCLYHKLYHFGYKKCGVVILKNNLISVIIPVFNAEDFIVDACRSVLSQSYDDFEILVVDDGSTDSSVAKVNDLAKNCDKIKLIRSENNGVCSARNIGLSNASGEYIIFLDADDLLMPNALETLYNDITDNECDIAICSKVDFKNKPDLNDITTAGNHTEIWTGEEALKFALESSPYTFSVWARIFTREIIGNTRFIEGKKLNEDSYFLFECFLKQPKVFVHDEIVYCYNVTNAKSSQKRALKFLSDIDFFLEKKRQAVQNDFPHLYDAFLKFEFNTKLNTMEIICVNHDISHDSEEKAIIDYLKKNKKRFMPSSKAKKRLLFMVTHNLYYIYKKVV